jgi:hypothetical protein
MAREAGLDPDALTLKRASTSRPSGEWSETITTCSPTALWSASADLMNLVRHDLGFSKTDKPFFMKSTCLSIYSRTRDSSLLRGYHRGWLLIANAMTRPGVLTSAVPYLRWRSK